MATSTKTSVRCVALFGNPNTGKSTLFSALSGIRQHVGNYPGTTVERKVGRLRTGNIDCELIDLPGTYSLAPRAPDELVAVDVLLARREDVPRPNVILCVVDASNLERNMYLVSQLLELELPMVVALNMVDVAASSGVTVDAKALSARLGVTIVPIHAKKGSGLDALKAAIEDARSATNSPPSFAPGEVQREINQLVQRTQDHTDMPRFLIERLLFDEAGHLTSAIKKGVPKEVAEALASARQRCLAIDPLLAETEAKSRYQWVDRQLSGVVRRNATIAPSVTDRADRLLLHPVWGWALAVVAMLVLFQSVFLIAEPASNLIDEVTGRLEWVTSSLVPAGALRSLLSDGIIAGVGGVLVFLPQIFLLFLFIALLEDSGYLARVACLMDRLLSRVGLSGKSFIPLLSSFACAIPGIMATRMIGDRRDRLVTILIAPLMSCSARLPVYTLLIAAFIPKRQWLGGLLGLQGLTMAAMYALGIVVAVLVAMILKKTVLRAETPSFLLELPTYKWPSPLVVARRVWDGGWSFVQGAGTLIVSVTVLVWATAYYPNSDADVDKQLFVRQREIQQLLAQTVRTSESNVLRSAELIRELDSVENAIQAARLQNSYLGRCGRLIEPVVRPLGWDWRIGCAVLASFPAREVVVATLGVIYKIGDEQDERSESLRHTLRKATWDGTERRVFGIPVALSLMVFFALCAQCASTLATMRRETNTWRWPVIAFAYMTSLAYIAALVTYQVGMAFSS